jgi:hypothetical protein
MSFAVHRLIFALLVMTAGRCLPAFEQQCKVSIDAVADITFDMLKQKMVSKTVFEYKRVQNGKTVSLYDVADTVKITVDGKLMSESVGDRTATMTTPTAPRFQDLDSRGQTKTIYRPLRPPVVHHLDARRKNRKRQIRPKAKAPRSTETRHDRQLSSSTAAS